MGLKSKLKRAVKKIRRAVDKIDPIGAKIHKEVGAPRLDPIAEGFLKPGGQLTPEGEKATTEHLQNVLGENTGGKVAAVGNYVHNYIAPGVAASWAGGIWAGKLLGTSTAGAAMSPRTGGSMLEGIFDFAKDLGRDVVRAAVNRKLMGSQQSGPVIPDIGPTGWMPVQATPAAFPALGGLGGLATRLGGGLATMGAAAVGVVRSVGGRIVGWVLPSGVKVSRKAAVRLAIRTGNIAATAAALGIAADELAEAIVQEQGRKRRGRGISAAQLRTTTRTIGKLERAHKQIARAARSHVRAR